jgi:heme A synthase
MNESIGPHFWALIFQMSQLEGGQREVTEALSIGAGIFALVLFALSLYAWSRRRQPALLIVSLAFLLFFATHVIEILESYEFNASIQLALSFMNFVILALFFIAVVVRPRRREQAQRS